MVHGAWRGRPRGLPEAFVAAAKAAAESAWDAGKAIVTLSRSSVEPFLKSSDRRDLREKVFRAFTARGDNGNANDNNATVVEILALREEAPRSWAYPTYAAYRLEDSMAKTPEAVRSLWSGSGSRRGRGRSPTATRCRHDRGRGRQFRAGAVGLALLRRKAAPGQSQFR
jgi:Zn-dependent oligopeptidase